MSDESQAAAAPEAAATETTEATKSESESVSLQKAEYDKMLQDLGSLKRENKDLKKPKDDGKDASAPDANELLQKTFLRAAQITAEDEVELALTTAKKWDMPVDKLVDDSDFQEKLEKHRTKKANELATSNVKGGAAGKSASTDPAYWIGKGTPPTADQVPSRKDRAAITRSLMANAKSGSKFYNDPK